MSFIVFIHFVTFISPLSFDKNKNKKTTTTKTQQNNNKNQHSF